VTDRFSTKKEPKCRWAWWLIAVIPVTQDAKTGSITFLGQPRQNVSKTPSPTISQAWRCTIIESQPLETSVGGSLPKDSNGQKHKILFKK
jgi:hypothetical protein